MRVLLCAFACHPEGTSGLGAGEDILGWNIARQAARFHDTWVLTHANNRDALEDACRVLDLRKRLHFEYVRLPAVLEWMARHHKGPLQIYSWFWQWAAYRAARRLHRENGFDLFHHVTFANDWLASPTGAFLPVPYVRGPGGGAHRMPKGLLRSRRWLSRIWERVRSVGQWIYRHDPVYMKGQRKARALLLCNHDAVAAVPRHVRDKTHLFPVNGIAPEEAIEMGAPVKRPAAERKRFIIVSAGHFISLKCFDLGIRAFVAFAREHPHAILELVGDGPERARLVRLVRDLGMTDQVRFPGWSSRTELLHRIAQADVFLFPSARDGGGAVVVEAMATGTPVVCLDIGGPGYHVQDIWGVKIDPGGTEQVIRDMARALHRLHDDPELRTAMGSAGKQRVQDVYLWDRLGEELNKIYKEACRVSGVECR